MSAPEEIPESLIASGYTREALERLRDPVWRLSSGLYRITNKRGQVVPFVPKPAQREVIDAVYGKRRRRILIPKARQLGFSTLIELIGLDTSLFRPNTQCAIVDQTQADASRKLTDKCKLAYENLPARLRCGLKTDSSKELGFGNGSSIVAGMRARGSTHQFLHISEWGPIAHEDPARSEEIRTGALPTVGDDGLVFVESTFKGGKGGAFYEEIVRAMEVPEELKTTKDFYLYFFPWWREEEYSLAGDMSRVTKRTHEYLDDLEKQTGRSFTPGQRLWYQVTAEEQGIFMLREYPSTLEECFRAPVEGAIYAKLIMQARAEGRVYDFNYDQAFPVYTSWDIGHSDTTEIWWFQLRGNRMDWVKHVSLKRHSAAQAAQVVRDSGIPVAAHYLPHDATSSHANTGSSYQQELQKAGLQNIKVVRRTPDIWIGINQLCDLMGRSQFSLKACADGIAALEVYHSKDEATEGRVVSAPVHDWSSHAADAARTAAEAINQGMVSDSSSISKQHRPGRMAWGGRALSAL